MIDAPKLRQKIAETLGDPRFGDPTFLADRLGLDLSEATITASPNGVFLVREATSREGGDEIGLIGAARPNRTLDAILAPPSSRF